MNHDQRQDFGHVQACKLQRHNRLYDINHDGLCLFQGSATCSSLAPLHWLPIALTNNYMEMNNGYLLTFQLSCIIVVRLKLFLYKPFT